MSFDYFGLVATLVTSIVAASVGAFLSARFGSMQRERAEAAKLRRDAANMLIDRLTALKGLMRSAEHSRDVTVWRDSIEATYDAFDDARHRLPVSLRHLKRSVRYAIGEATALSLVDHWRSGEDENDEMAPYDYRWTTYAIEYVDLAVDSLRRWRDCDQRVADKIQAPGFDDWLRETGRHVTGGA